MLNFGPVSYTKTCLDVLITADNPCPTSNRVNIAVPSPIGLALLGPINNGTKKTTPNHFEGNPLGASIQMTPNRANKSAQSEAVAICSTDKLNSDNQDNKGYINSKLRCDIFSRKLPTAGNGMTNKLPNKVRGIVTILTQGTAIILAISETNENF